MFTCVLITVLLATVAFVFGSILGQSRQRDRSSDMLFLVHHLRKFLSQNPALADRDTVEVSSRDLAELQHIVEQAAGIFDE